MQGNRRKYVIFEKGSPECEIGTEFVTLFLQ